MSVSCYDPENLGSLAFSGLIVFGTWASWAPQQIEILLKRSSEGISEFFVFMLTLANFTNILSTVILQWDVFQCCAHLDFSRCNNLLLPEVWTVGSNFINVYPIYLLFVIFFPRVRRHSASFSRNSDSFSHSQKCKYNDPLQNLQGECKSHLQGEHKSHLQDENESHHQDENESHHQDENESHHQDENENYQNESEDYQNEKALLLKRSSSLQDHTLAKPNTFDRVAQWWDTAPLQNYTSVWLVFLGFNTLMIASFVLLYFLVRHPHSFRLYGDALGVITSVLNVIMWIPQIVHTWQLGQAGSLSLVMLLMQTPGSLIVFLWEFFGAQASWAVSLPFFAMFVMSLILTSEAVFFEARIAYRSFKAGKGISLWGKTFFVQRAPSGTVLNLPPTINSDTQEFESVVNN